MLVPIELDHPQTKRCCAIEDAEVASAVQAEPDPVIPPVAWAVPDQVDRVRLLGCETVGCRRARRAADIAPGVEAAGPRIVDDAVRHPVGGVASGHGGCAGL